PIQNRHLSRCPALKNQNRGHPGGAAQYISSGAASRERRFRGAPRWCRHWLSRLPSRLGPRIRRKSPQLAIDGSGRPRIVTLGEHPSDRCCPANNDQRPTGSSGHKVICLWSHSLQAYSTRPWSTSALTRLDAPHLLHFTSSRVLPCVMVTFRAIASLTKRSDSWRIASFDIAGARGFRTINSSSQSLVYFPPRPNRFLSPPPAVERRV